MQPALYLQPCYPIPNAHEHGRGAWLGCACIRKPVRQDNHSLDAVPASSTAANHGARREASRIGLLERRFWSGAFPGGDQGRNVVSPVGSVGALPRVRQGARCRPLPSRGDREPCSAWRPDDASRRPRAARPLCALHRHCATSSRRAGTALKRAGYGTCYAEGVELLFHFTILQRD